MRSTITPMPSAVGCIPSSRLSFLTCRTPTSLLMVLAGLERVTSGQVKVAGEDFTRLSEDDLALVRGREIGIVFQSSTSSDDDRTGERRPPAPVRRTCRCLRQCPRAPHGSGPRTWLDHYPAQLSGGEQQRVALARALSPNPQLLLADEPTGNLDTKNGRQVTDLLFGLQRRRQATLVLVTHDERLAAECERVIRMADGMIAADERAAAA